MPDPVILLLVIVAELAPFVPTAEVLRRPIPFSRESSIVLPVIDNVRTVLPVMLIPSIDALEIVQPDTVTAESELSPLNCTVPCSLEFTMLTVFEPLPVANVKARMNLPDGRSTTLVEHVNVAVRT